MNFFLFPVPRHAEFGSLNIDFSNARNIKFEPEFSSDLKQIILAVSEEINAYFPVRLEATAGKPGAGQLLLSIAPVNDKLKKQQYRLESLASGITLEGGSEAALFWGLRTLSQLLPQTGPFVPEFKIDDWPDFANRGYMLDVSRCKVPTMDSLFSLIDHMADLKFNQLQLYMEHTFAFAAHERVWFDSSPFTSGEIMELDRYCRERFIELVPNFNSFGHLERWLKFDEYKHLAECPDGYESPHWGHSDGGVLKPDADSLTFLDSLYAELLPNFTSRQFNIGCDETWELGQGWSKPMCEEKGKNRVYLDFLLQVAALAEKHGRSVMFWGDIILHQPELITELPKNITAMNWGYEARHPFADETARFASSGVPFYVCPGTSAWNSLTGRTDNCVANLINAAENGDKNGAAGYLITDWGDCGHHQYYPVSWLGLSAGAAFSWCLSSNRDADLAEAIDILWANDDGGVIGDYLADFGRICNAFAKPVCNNTIFAKAMFEPISKGAELLKDTTVEEINAALARTLELRAQLSSASPRCDDADILLNELRNGSFMTEASLKKMLLMKEEKIDISSLLDLMRHVIANHDRLWLARNRNGGLYESSGALRSAMADIQSFTRNNLNSRADVTMSGW